MPKNPPSCSDGVPLGLPPSTRSVDEAAGAGCCPRARRGVRRRNSASSGESRSPSTVSDAGVCQHAPEVGADPSETSLDSSGATQVHVRRSTPTCCRSRRGPGSTSRTRASALAQYALATGRGAERISGRAAHRRPTPRAAPLLRGPSRCTTLRRAGAAPPGTIRSAGRTADGRLA